MRRPHYALLFFAGLICILVLGALVIVGIVATMTSPLEFRSLASRILAGTMLAFLVVLVFRYVALLWLSYLQTIDQMGTPEEIEEMRGRFLPPVSILVPVYNEGKVIDTAMRSLLRLDYPQYEVLVIDDGSSDDTFERASRFEGEYGHVRVRVYRKSNGGKASALNVGLSAADYPYVLCMDGDSILDPETLRNSMHNFLLEDVGAVAGNVKVGNRINLWTRLQALEYVEGLNLPRRAQAFIRAVNIIPGAIGIFRRDVLLNVGGYDTDTYAEDADVTLKLLAGGWRVVYEEKAIAYTEAPERLQPLIKQRYRWTRGILQALHKHRKVVWQRSGDVAIRLSVAQMIFETIVWPFLNVFGHLGFGLFAIAFGVPATVAGWWILITLLEVAVALLSVSMEEEDLSLVPLAVLYRFFFMFIVDVAKMLASIEEMLKLEMSWGKLERTGSLGKATTQ